MDNAYFTPEERLEVISMVKELLTRHAGLLQPGDARRVHDLTVRGIESGKLGRYANGLNPVLRHLSTATLLTRHISPDRNMVIATLLYQLCRHDVVSIDEVTRDFGEDIAVLIGGLKRVALLYSKHAQVQDDNYHKLHLTFAQDIRVIIIMIVDRMALMRKINHHPDEDFVRQISLESRYLYAPLAHRLGLYQIKSELEDLSLKYLNRKVYTQIAQKLNETKIERDKYVNDFIEPIRRALLDAGLKFEIKGRTKSINSIWNKMKTKDVDLNGIYDLFAIRIILDSAPEAEKRDCWVTYSIVTDIYTANTSRMRDWITIPKSNGYESLHTTVIGPDDKWVEVQIRTQRMDEIAERGLAAHWKYKGIKSEGDLDVWMNSVREVLEAGSEGQMELMRKVQRNVYDKEVFVFTPRGDLFKLPQGATVLDFAFAIHTRVGCTCIGATVDGKNQRINYRLKNGDTVEVLTASTQVPRQDWLNIVATSKARTKIRQALNETQVRMANMGREQLQRRFRNRKIDYDEGVVTRLLKPLGYKTLTEFFVAIHEGALDVNTIVERYEAQVERQNEPTSALPHGTAQDFVLHQREPAESEHTNDDILVIGNNVKGINYKLSRCCNPIYGDKIVGFIASDGAIKIHRADCGNVRHLISKYPYRMIKTKWSGKIGAQFAATLRVVGKDDIGIVSNITSVVNKTDNTSLRSISINSHNGMFEGFMVLGISSLNSLDDLIKKISQLRGVKEVTRASH